MRYSVFVLFIVFLFSFCWIKKGNGNRFPLLLCSNSDWCSLSRWTWPTINYCWAGWSFTSEVSSTFHFKDRAYQLKKTQEKLLPFYQSLPTSFPVSKGILNIQVITKVFKFYIFIFTIRLYTFHKHYQVLNLITSCK